MFDKILEEAGGTPACEPRTISNGAGECRPFSIHFGDAPAEYTAAAETVALFDRSDHCQLRMEGSDAARFLHNFCTNDIERLEMGSGCEAFVTNVKGRIVGHLFVFRTADALDIETTPAADQVLLPHWERFLFSEDVRFDCLDDRMGTLFVSGAECWTLLKQWTHQDGAGSIEPPPGVWQQDCRLGGIPVKVRRLDLLGAPGVSIIVRREQLSKLWQVLRDAGARPAGAQAFHARRIEAGLPLYGIDMTDQMLAQEAGRTQQAISFTKGCYLGQEPIARIDAVGHTNRQLQVLEKDAPELPEAGDEVHDPSGKPIGTVTSSVRHPGTQRCLMLALMKKV